MMIAASLALVLAAPPLACRTQEVPAPALQGPRTAAGESGPARFIDALYDGFSVERALECAAFADGFYRAPANDGYEATLDHIAARLRAAGFGGDPRLRLAMVETEMRLPSWTPVRARLELLRPGEEPERLHGFEKPADRDRVMLPVNAPSGSARGPVVFALEDVVAGSVLMVEEGLGRRLVADAAGAGAVAVLSSSLSDLTVDPTGAERHLDAIQFRTLPPGSKVPVAQVSPRTYRRLRALAEAGGAPEVALEAEVALAERPLRTLVAEVVGAARPEEAVAVACHVQEPGAGDNASGLAGVAQGACALAAALEEGALEWPARTIAFIWGDEYEQSRVWLRHTERTAIAGISADMLGQSRAQTGAVALLERTPDPGAMVTIPPDAHTPWGAGRVSRRDLKPNGLAVVARTALHDVGRHAGGWHSSENPWEGGSDHDVFLRQGVPAVLLWHFTDFSYHTGLDRMEMLDGEELRRSSVAVVALALAVADARPTDLARYEASLELERELRVAAARAAGRDDVAADWEAWCEGARGWLRGLCEP